VEDRFSRDINGYQDQIVELQSQLEKMKSEMSDRLREYQDLLSVKLGWFVLTNDFIFTKEMDNKWHL